MSDYIGPLTIVNATCDLNMKTKLRYRQTPSLLAVLSQKSLLPYILYFAVRSLILPRKW